MNIKNLPGSWSLNSPKDPPAPPPSLQGPVLIGRFLHPCLVTAAAAVPAQDLGLGGRTRVRHPEGLPWFCECPCAWGHVTLNIRNKWNSSKNTKTHQEKDYGRKEKTVFLIFWTEAWISLLHRTLRSSQLALDRRTLQEASSCLFVPHKHNHVHIQGVFHCCGVFYFWLYGCERRKSSRIG